MEGLLSCSSRNLVRLSDSNMLSVFLMSCLLSEVLKMSRTLTWSSGSLVVLFFSFCCLSAGLYSVNFFDLYLFL